MSIFITIVYTSSLVELFSWQGSRFMQALSKNECLWNLYFESMSSLLYIDVLTLVRFHQTCQYSTYKKEIVDFQIMQYSERMASGINRMLHFPINLCLLIILLLMQLIHTGKHKYTVSVRVYFISFFEWGVYFIANFGTSYWHCNNEQLWWKWRQW